VGGEHLDGLLVLCSFGAGDRLEDDAQVVGEFVGELLEAELFQGLPEGEDGGAALAGVADGVVGQEQRRFWSKVST
jgi:hypothetical protein